MKLYNKPLIELVKFNYSDIVSASNTEDILVKLEETELEILGWGDSDIEMETEPEMVDGGGFGIEIETTAESIVETEIETEPETELIEESGFIE